MRSVLCGSSKAVLVVRRAIVDDEGDDAEEQTGDSGQGRRFARTLFGCRFPFGGSRFGFGCCRVELGFVDHDERRVVEVATRVGVRIDEEAFGATFHGLKLEGLL